MAKYFDADILDGRIESYEDALVACHDYDFIFNCAGYNDVDGCEENTTKASIENSLLPDWLSMACREGNRKYIHVSTGCIFDGFVDQHTLPNARTEYAISKIIGENNAIINNPETLIVRIRLPFDHREHPREFITKLMKMKQVHDVQNSFTCIDDFLWALGHLIKNDHSGVYNLLNHGATSPYQIAKMIGLDVEKIEFDDIKTKVKRVNTIIKCGELSKLGIPMRDIDTALEDVIGKRFK